MSDSHALDALKAHAKQLLTLARAGDVNVIGALRKFLPRLAQLSDSDFAANVKLADVQHAVAAGRGMKNWAELKSKTEAIDPLTVQAERFLHAVREEQGTRAQELLEAHPAIARYSIHAAAAACDAIAVEEFLKRDLSLATAAAPPNKAEPIIYACGTRLHNTSDANAAGNARCVQLLLEAGANANAVIMIDSEGGEAPISALYFACAGNNIPATRMLLEHGAKPNDGESVYHAAERNNRECLELLLQHGADLSSAHTRWGNTPLYFLAGYKTFSPLFASSELGMCWLLENGANPNVTSHSSNENSPNRGETPLHRVAAYGKSVDVVRMLIEHGALPDVPRGDGKTPYVLAVRTGNIPVAEFLAGIGANTSALTPRDQLIGACAVANESAARKILADNPGLLSSLTAEDRQAFALAIEEGRDSSVKLMLDLGWDIAAEGEWGGTPLHMAAWFGRPAMTQLLVNLGAPINYRDKTYGSSPLAWAAHGSTNSRPGNDDDYCAVIDILLKAGSSREASYNSWNEPPESMSSKAVAKLLKKRGFAA